MHVMSTALGMAIYSKVEVSLLNRQAEEKNAYNQRNSWFILGFATTDLAPTYSSFILCLKLPSPQRRKAKQQSYRLATLIHNLIINYLGEQLTTRQSLRVCAQNLT